MPSYMLLLYDRAGESVEMSPAEMQAVIQKYRDWGDGLRQSGCYVDSHKLRDGEGRVMKPGNGSTRVLDGPFSETKEVIGGYFTVSAADYEEAVRLAEGCPHLSRGGTIEVRQIEETG